MKKKILYDQNAKRELRKFSEEVQDDFVSKIELLGREGRLRPPDSKKIERNLFEIRIRREGSYRGFYAYIWGDYIVILHFFQKKTQKTPLKNIKIAKVRLRRYE